PNGSTALHAASFYGHYDIVRLLLNARASRSIKNKYECLPIHEAKTSQIRELFLRNESNRFGDDTGNLQWTKVDSTIYQQALYKRLWLKSAWSEHKMLNKLDWMIESCLIHKVPILSERSEIQSYFRQAKLTRDPSYLIKAYTAETDYYKKLNRDFALEDFDKDWTSNMQQWIVSTLYNHISLEQFCFKGKTYRGMKMNAADIAGYVIGTRIMNKSFLSTSKDQSVAEEFARQPSKDIQLQHSVLCVYETRNNRTALDIETMSEYPHEKEVLILPYAAFKVVNIIPSTSSVSLPNDNKKQLIKALDFEIHLRECKSFTKETVQKLKFQFTNAHKSSMMDDFELEQQLASYSF
ncbi:unnamed protein product, partial [Didymodactylos carnosus]